MSRKPHAAVAAAVPLLSSKLVPGSPAVLRSVAPLASVPVQVSVPCAVSVEVFWQAQDPQDPEEVPEVLPVPHFAVQAECLVVGLGSVERRHSGEAPVASARLRFSAVLPSPVAVALSQMGGLRHRSVALRRSRKREDAR